jgi:hypothetical protein
MRSSLALVATPFLLAGCSSVTTPVSSTPEPQPTQAVAAPPEVPWIVFTEHAEARDIAQENGRLLQLLDRGQTFMGETITHPGTDIDWVRTTDFGREAFVIRAAVHRIHPSNVVDGNISIGSEKVDRWWGLPLEYEPADLAPVPMEWSGDVERERPYQLRAEALDALVRMLEAARADGIEIRVISAYRSGSTQRNIFLRNITRSGAAQRYSAPPGHSEHQLGTCVDLTDAAQQHDFSRTFDEQPEGKWLEQNATRFGFVRSYRPENVDQTGYISEPWHWRYWGETGASAK